MLKLLFPNYSSRNQLTEPLLPTTVKDKSSSVITNNSSKNKSKLSFFPKKDEDKSESKIKNNSSIIKSEPSPIAQNSVYTSISLNTFYKSIKVIHHFENNMQSILEDNDTPPNPDALFNKGIEILDKHWKTPQADQGMTLIKKAADLNNVKALNKLGQFYHEGVGLEKNEKLSIQLFERAAEESFPPAINNLGLCYLFGDGVEKNYKMAFDLFQQAVKISNYPSALNNLGFCYKEGLGISCDYRKAYELYKLSSEQGFHPAQNNLALCYEFGIGVEKNLKEALIWYNKSADGNHELGIKNLNSFIETHQ